MLHRLPQPGLAAAGARALATSMILLLGACGAGSEGRGAEWQFFGSGRDVEAQDPDELPIELTRCSHDEDCAVLPAACRCDGVHWVALRRIHARGHREAQCDGQALPQALCDDPPAATCDETQRCAVGR